HPPFSVFFFSSRRRHTRFSRDWSSDVCSSDLCDLIRGSAHLRTSVSKGLEIIEGLRGHTTGYAIPQFVIDGPGGGGKIPLNPNYIVHRDPEKIVLRNYEGEIFEYPEPTPVPTDALERLRDSVEVSCRL